MNPECGGQAILWEQLPLRTAAVAKGALAVSEKHSLPAWFCLVLRMAV